MNAKSTRRAASALAAAAAIALPISALAAEVTQARLEAPYLEPQNWLLPRQNYQAQNYSTLDAINRTTIRQLQPLFTVPLSEALRYGSFVDLQNAPLVDDGFLYTDTMSHIYKIDVRSGRGGRVVWKTDLSVSLDENSRTRGIAFWNDLVIRNLTDGRVVAVDRNSGEVVWDEQIARVPHPGAAGVPDEWGDLFTGTPVAADGKVLVGNSNGDAGSRGWVAALDVATGKEEWRFYTVPAPGEPGHETWADDHNAWRTGGAAVWALGSYAVRERLFIQGTGSPTPMYDAEFRPGDNLYSDSVVALRIDDGTLAWYFQYTPNDSWDYDETGTHMLIDVPVDGTTRPLVAHFGRNGFFYRLDRRTGEFVGASQYVARLNWTSGIDPATGRPLEYDPDLDLQIYRPSSRSLRSDPGPKISCPQLGGGTRWQPTAYDPATMTAYVFGEDGCHSRAIMTTETLPTGAINEHGRIRGRSDGLDITGLIAAVDVRTGRKIAELYTPYPNHSGGIATRGGLLFTANLDGTVAAHDSRTLERLWEFDTGIGFKAPPVTYAVGGRQYVAINAGFPLVDVPELGVPSYGAMLFVFGLGPEPSNPPRPPNPAAGGGGGEPEPAETPVRGYDKLWLGSVLGVYR